MNTNEYQDLKKKVIEAGYQEEIDQQNEAGPPSNALWFANECIWVIIASGIKNQVARKIEARIAEVLDGYLDSSEMPEQLGAVFRNKGKVKAIETILKCRESVFATFVYYYERLPGSLPELLSYFESLPYIGKITKYHLAKNVGVPVCKPDRHLVRIANEYGVTPQALCERLALETGDKVSVVDLIIWRAANLGLR